MITLPVLSSAIIQCFEGCRLDPYQDSGGVWTIGYGTTRINNVPVSNTTRITQSQADDLLAIDQAPLFALVQSRPILEAAALVSFGYNCGIGTLKRWIASESLPDGDAMKITLSQFIHAGGAVLPGLVRRRYVEQTLIDLSRQLQSNA